MGNATAVSDIERAEHLNYADGKGVKRVTAYNDGVQVNVATETKQDAQIQQITDFTHTNVHTGSKEFRTFSEGHLCVPNSTTTPLGINGVFTGAWEDTLDFSEVSVSVYTDKSSITDGLDIQWSMDGVTVHAHDTFTISATSGKQFTFPCNPRYVRVVYTNDGVAQTYFVLQTMLKRYASKGSSHRLKDALQQEDDGIVTKSLIAGFTTAGGGTLVDVKVNPSGALQVGGTLDTITTLPSVPVSSLPSANQSAFGTLETAELTPVFQGDFVYGLNTQMWATGVTSGTGATVDTDASRLRIQSGTGAAGYAYIQTRRPARYRAGQGTLARFTPLFSAGIANNIQVWGMFSIASNVPYDGYGFGYNGTNFGIVHYIRGSATWTAQTAWNGDKVDGTTGTAFNWNPTYGIPVQIKYPYLGYGDIFFYVQNPSTGAWVLVHTIRYANTVSTTQLSNPTMKFTGFTLNSGNTTNKTMYCASVGIFISGVRSFVGNPKWTMDSNKSSITTETNIITLKNATTYNGVTNTGMIRLNSLSVASSAATGIAVFRLKIGATLGGVPSYTTINGTTADAGVTITSGNSVTSYDTAGTTVAGGTYVFSVSKDNPGSTIVDLTPYEIFIAPGDTLTISAFSSANSTVSASINWSEDI